MRPNMHPAYNTAYNPAYNSAYNPAYNTACKPPLRTVPHTAWVAFVQQHGSASIQAPLAQPYGYYPPYQ